MHEYDVKSEIKGMLQSIYWYTDMQFIIYIFMHKPKMKSKSMQTP